MKNADTEAMPQYREGEYDALSVTGGLTKREHFAGLAMQALMANPTTSAHVSRMARSAVVAADALLEQLAK